MTTENVCNFLQVSWKLQTKTKTRRFVKMKIVKLKIVFSDILKPEDTFQNTGCVNYENTVVSITRQSQRIQDVKSIFRR